MLECAGERPYLQYTEDVAQMPSKRQQKEQDKAKGRCSPCKSGKPSKMLCVAVQALHRAVIVNRLTGKLIGCANFLGYRLLA